MIIQYGFYQLREYFNQQCIPVGCVPPALGRGGGGTYPPPPVNRQTPVKALPSATSLAGGKNKNGIVGENI